MNKGNYKISDTPVKTVKSKKLFPQTKSLCNIFRFFFHKKADFPTCKFIQMPFLLAGTFAAAILLLNAGCNTDPAVSGSIDEDIFSRIYRNIWYEKPFYTDDAIEKARRYAIENLKDLSEDTVHEIEFTRPQIYQRKLFSRAARESSRRDISETWIVWKIPDSDGQNVVVFGVGQSRLDDWYPVRAVIKKFEPTEDNTAQQQKNETKKETEAK